MGATKQVSKIQRRLTHRPFLPVHSLTNGIKNKNMNIGANSLGELRQMLHRSPELSGKEKNTKMRILSVISPLLPDEVAQALHLLQSHRHKRFILQSRHLFPAKVVPRDPNEHRDSSSTAVFNLFSKAKQSQRMATHMSTHNRLLGIWQDEQDE